MYNYGRRSAGTDTPFSSKYLIAPGCNFAFKDTKAFSSVNGFKPEFTECASSSSQTLPLLADKQHHLTYPCSHQQT